MNPLDRIEQRAQERLEMAGANEPEPELVDVRDVLALVAVARAAQAFIEDEANYERLVQALAALVSEPAETP